MHKQPVFKKKGLFEKEKFPISEKLYYQGFYLPSGLTLNEDKIKLVSRKLKSLF